MFTFYPPPCEMFDYWGIDLPSSFVVPPPETKLSFILGDHSPHIDDFEVKYGDVIYGFIGGQMVIACEVIDMLTPPEAQAVISNGDARYYLTTVATRVMPVRPEILYRPGGLTEDDEPMAEAIAKAQADARAWGLPQMDGVVWPWGEALGLGNEILTILDRDAQEQRQVRERRTALKELARGAVIH